MNENNTIRISESLNASPPTTIKIQRTFLSCSRRARSSRSWSSRSSRRRSRSATCCFHRWSRRFTNATRNLTPSLYCRLRVLPCRRSFSIFRVIISSWWWWWKGGWTERSEPHHHRSSEESVTGAPRQARVFFLAPSFPRHQTRNASRSKRQRSTHLLLPLPLHPAPRLPGRVRKLQPVVPVLLAKVHIPERRPKRLPRPVEHWSRETSGRQRRRRRQVKARIGRLRAAPLAATL